MAGAVLAASVFDVRPSWRAVVQVAGRGRTERRILLTFVRYGVTTQPASSVRGSSRRIMTMRFRPADIRVINRRTCSSPPPVLLRMLLLPHLLLRAFPDRVYLGLPDLLTSRFILKGKPKRKLKCSWIADSRNLPEAWRGSDRILTTSKHSVKADRVYVIRQIESLRYEL